MASGAINVGKRYTKVLSVKSAGKKDKTGKVTEQWTTDGQDHSLTVIVPAVVPIAGKDGKVDEAKTLADYISRCAAFEAERGADGVLNVTFDRLDGNGQPILNDKGEQLTATQRNVWPLFGVDDNKARVVPSVLAVLDATATAVAARMRAGAQSYLADKWGIDKPKTSAAAVNGNESYE